MNLQNCAKRDSTAYREWTEGIRTAVTVVQPVDGATTAGRQVTGVGVMKGTTVQKEQSIRNRALLVPTKHRLAWTIVIHVKQVSDYKA